MKSYTFLFIAFFSFFLSGQAFAQKKTVEDKFWAAGVCGMCQNRIETALDIPGVKFATWDKETQIVTVIYREDKVSLKQLQDKVSSVGHQTKEIPKNEKAYADLPKCCQYDSGAKKH
ncbi:MAG: heavy-metal-associated domain-containing protein [Bacteroidia bacterium]|nr:heavy-metal-associated domain-containing protein [Bacteroidia bacterium]